MNKPDFALRGREINHLAEICTRKEREELLAEEFAKLHAETRKATIHECADVAHRECMNATAQYGQFVACDKLQDARTRHACAEASQAKILALDTPPKQQTPFGCECWYYVENYKHWLRNTLADKNAAAIEPDAMFCDVCGKPATPQWIEKVKCCRKYPPAVL